MTYIITYIYVYIYIYMCVCMYIYMCVCVHVCMCVYVCIACVCACVCVCVYVCMHACMDVCIHICEACHKWVDPQIINFNGFSHKPSSSDPSTSRLLTWAALAVSRRIIFVPFGSMPLDLADGNYRLATNVNVAVGMFAKILNHP